MSTRPKNTLLRSVPYFPVENVENTVKFCENVFGFKPEYTAGRPMQFAICSRDGLAVMFRYVSNPERICPSEKQGGHVGCFFLDRQCRGSSCRP